MTQPSPQAATTSPATLYPLRFEPILKHILWGGRRLGTVLGKPIGEGSDYAESWEVSDHRNGQSVVAEGPLKGQALHDLVVERGEELLGPAIAPRTQFPLLVKFIDAQDVLSVQVHPDDESGRRLANDNGKTETWVVLDVEPGSFIYAGLKAGVTREAFAAAMEADEVEPLLHKFLAKPGDCILIPAGTMHAIGRGVLLAEVQQMSDATFRVYDWGRVGADGKPRQLHLAEALEVTDFEAGPVDPLRPDPDHLPNQAGTREALARSDYFALERLTLAKAAPVGSRDRFTIVVGMEGEAEVRHGGESYPLGRGQTLLLPAAIGACEIGPRGEGPATVLTCVVP